MSRLQPRARHILVFAVRGKRKIGRFVTPTKGALADYHATQKILLAEFGHDVRIRREGATVGSRGLIIDAYELESVSKNLWPAYRKLLPAQKVAEIEQEVKDSDGYLMAEIVHEDSIFALEEEGHG